MPKHRPTPVPPTNDVRTRRVHYIGGFDPRGARAYHRLYREEAAKQVKHHPDTTIEVGPRKRLSENINAWNVHWKSGEHEVHTQYQYMGWDDLVREHWIPKLSSLVAWSIHFYYHYIGTGALRRVRLASRQTWFSGIFPPWYLILLAAAVVLVALGVGAGAYALLGWWLAIPLGLAAGYAIWRPGLKLGERFCVMWLLRTYIFVLALGSRPLPKVEARINEFVDHILREQEKNPVDEVLIVGHSVGSQLSVSVAARILERCPDGKFSPAFHLLTLGECIPLLGFVRGATRFRYELERVSKERRLPWTDVAVPPDPLCFYPANPAKACHLKETPEDRPNRVVARIFRMFSQDEYAKIRMNKLRIHFQYLMASELAADYDYYLITAGPSSLASVTSRER